jgi:DNA repair protein RadC
VAARELVRRALAETFGIGCQLASPAAVRDYLRLFLGGQEYESFVALWLDAQNRLIAGMELFRGTTTQTSVYPREVVQDGLKLNASAVILAHNHPSGQSRTVARRRDADQPSFERVGARRHQGARPLHRGRHRVMSFAEKGLI